MAEPTTSLILGPVGVKIGAFLGSLATLAFTANRLKRFPAVFSVFMGTVASLYLTDIAVHFYPSISEIKEPIAFLLGLTSMNIIGGIFVKFTRFRKNGDVSEFKDIFRR